MSGGIATNERAMQGRLEVQLPSGAWSTVCDDGFTNLAASVVCRQVGRGDGKGTAVCWEQLTKV